MLYVNQIDLQSVLNSCAIEGKVYTQYTLQDGSGFRLLFHDLLIVQKVDKLDLLNIIHSVLLYTMFFPLHICAVLIDPNFLCEGLAV